MGRLRVAVLGPPEVHHGGRLLAFPARKTLALLVYLLVEGGPQPRDKLAALLWPDSAGEAARATVRSALARLRDGLADDGGEAHLVIEREAVAFDVASDYDLDLHVLRDASGLARTLTGRERPAGDERRSAIARLQLGADAWRGEFLEGFSLRDAPEFDDWATAQREVWRRRLEGVLDRLSLLHADAGAGAAAVETVTRWLRVNPLEERAHRRLMRLHLASGDRAAALRAYNACRAVLDRELGIRPAPETEALAERARSMPVPGGAAGRSLRAAPVPPAIEGALVGRADEFGRLVASFHAAAQGRPQAVVLSGEAGIGKTRLATEFLGWAAARGADVLQGRAFEAGARLPYQPLVDAIRPRLDREAAPGSLLSDTWLVELSRLLPDLRDRRPDLAPAGGDEAAARTRLFEAVARLGRALADRAPLVLFVDDVQWSDVASLDVLRYAARRWIQDEVPVLLLLCLRSEALATTPVLDEWLLALRRDLTVTRLDLGPLTFDDTLQLLQGLEPGPPPTPELEAFARWLFAETGGQPLFVIETLKALLERGALAPSRPEAGGWGIDLVRTPDQGQHHGVVAPGVRQTILARLAPLDPTARDLLVAAAVLAQEFGFDLLCRVGHLSDDDALLALDQVLRAQVLRETGGRYVFAHDKIRDVVYGEAGEARRRVFHRRALDALEATGAPAAELARHALAAGLDEAALRLTVAAGDEAMRLLAARDAAAHYERALVLAARLGRRDLLAELRARRGHAFVSVAMWLDARRELETALGEVGADRPDRQLEILADLTEACWWLLDVPAMRRHATTALDLAERIGRADLETMAMAWLGAAEGSAGNLTACVEQNRRALARALGVAPPVIAGNYESMSLYWLGRLNEAVGSSRDAVALAREANDIPWAILSLSQLGIALAGTGRYAEAIGVFDETRRLGRDYGVENLLARAIAMSTGFRLDLYDFAEAETLSHEARELARSVDFRPPGVSAGIDLMLNYARRQEVGRAEELVAEVAAAAADTAGFHGWLWRLRLAQARAEMGLARGDWAEALRWAHDAIAQSRARGRVKYEASGLATRAQALIALNRTTEALADLRAALALARPLGDPALFLRTAAALLAVDGDDALAAEAGAARERIATALPDPDLRRRFAAAAPLACLSPLLQAGIAAGG